MHRPFAALLLAMLAAASAAAPPEAAPGISAAPSAAALERGLAGRWQGSLGYRDYQSNQMFELPVTTEIRALPDGATILRTSSFDDGPKTGLVWITTASLYDAKAGTVTSATLRKGRPVTLSTEAQAVAAYADARHWTIVATEDGSDDDKPALLRITEVRDGDRLVATKEVSPRGDGQAPRWQFRNRLTLQRLP